MSFGAMTLSIAAVLVFCGLLQRVLDRMHLTDRQALLVIALMLIGSFLPDVVLGALSINIGGAVIPICICIFLIIKADETAERWRAVWGSLISAASIYLLSKLLPAEAEALPVDPIWIYGACGGIIAWGLGRSRRSAFICGVLGVLLADILNAVLIYAQGYRTELHLGGAGLADAAVISGATAVLLCEILGEAIERIVRRSIERRE